MHSIAQQLLNDCVAPSHTLRVLRAIPTDPVGVVVDAHKRRNDREVVDDRIHVNPRH